MAPAEADHDLTLLVPSFDEERRLPGTLAGIADFLGGWGVDYRVVVVDDGSQDGTALVSRRFGRRFSTLCLGRRCGKGAAVRQGMLAATGRVVAFTDADLPYDLGALRTACEWIETGECEAVFGARDIAGSACQARRRLSRIAASAAFRQVVKLAISRDVTDTQCGLKAFSRRAAIEIFSRTTLDGFAFDAEVVLLCHRLRLTFRRVPVRLVNEYSSTLSLSRHSGRMLRDVLWLAWRDRLSGRRPPPIRTRPEQVWEPRRAA
ncbi:MAG TPA: glycosyltransferase [Pirellulales bacterium]|nr:glycosyltransferase [Pirellulales bacterium]